MLISRHLLRAPISAPNLRVGAGVGALSLWAAALVACEGREPFTVPTSSVSEIEPAELSPGGDATVEVDPTTFLRAAANLPSARRADFYAGKALAGQPWVRAPASTDARDGLGPLYNARTCFACHVEGGRGEVPVEDGPLSIGTVVRLSLPGSRGEMGAVPEPTYGLQLQLQSVDVVHQLRAVRPEASSDPALPPEARVSVRWIASDFVYPDGHQVSRRRPELEITDLAYGALHADVQVGLRHAPPLYGLGLVDHIPESALLVREDPEDRDGDGISGRANRVWDPEIRQLRVGRFGHKANQATLRAQVASALRDDIGITSSLFPEPPCSPRQAACLRGPHGTGDAGVEISDALLDLMVRFNRDLGVPKRRKPEHPLVRAGRARFEEVGCASCHQPKLVTAASPAAPHLGDQIIWPYSDFLLHDLGPELADGRPDFGASGREWRTAPLWGVGLARAVRAEVGFLHDGRARTVEEAILWHGGEAQASRDRFASLDPAARRALIAFVKSL